MCFFFQSEFLSMLFSPLAPGHLAANDVSISRTKRLYQILSSYVPKNVREAVSVTSYDGRDWAELEGGTFHKVSD